MGFVEAVKSFFKRWSDFNTRSSRSEYWWAYLGTILISIVAGIVIGLFSAVGGEALGGILMLVFYVVMLVPSIAVGVRKGTTGPNRFGPDPLGADTNVFN